MTKKETMHCSGEHCKEEHCASEQNSPSNKEEVHQCKGACKEESTELTEFQELTQTLQLLQADFENYKKRVERDHADFKRYAVKQLLAEIIPVLDNFGHALKTVDDEGVRLIHIQLMGVLEKYGLKEIECLGTKFDPKFQEALLQEESEKEPNTILEILQKGYIVGDTVLRPARVKIAKKS